MLIYAKTRIYAFDNTLQQIWNYSTNLADGLLLYILDWYPTNQSGTSMPVEEEESILLVWAKIATIEEHVTGYTGEVEARLGEIQQIFDATVSELSEKLATLEAELAEKTEALQEAESANAVLVDQITEGKEAFESDRSDNAELTTENDGLRGQVARMDKEHKVAVQSLQTENKELLKQHATERARVSDEHTTALAS